MAKQGHNKTRPSARPINTKRDFDNVTAVVKQLVEKPERDTGDELRLQLMLDELDKFDQSEDDADADVSVDDYYSGPGQRWSDETSES